LPKTVMFGIMEGTNRRGRRRKNDWMIHRWRRRDIYSINRAAQNRKLWSKIKVRTAGTPTGIEPMGYQYQF